MEPGAEPAAARTYIAAFQLKLDVAFGADPKRLQHVTEASIIRENGFYGSTDDGKPVGLYRAGLGALLSSSPLRGELPMTVSACRGEQVSDDPPGGSKSRFA